MKTEEIQKLLTRASDLVAMRQEYVPEFQSVLAKGQLLQKNIRECGEQLRSLTVEECLELVPEASRPRVIKFPEGELANSALLQLNPLTHYAVWIFPTRITKTQGWFRFKLGGFPSREFYEVCWCNSCLGPESKEIIKPRLVELCAKHDITKVLLRLKGSQCYLTGKKGFKVWLAEADYNADCFPFKEEVSAQAIKQSTSFVFHGRESKDELGQRLWISVANTSFEIEHFSDLYLS